VHDAEFSIAHTAANFTQIELGSDQDNKAAR